MGAQHSAPTELCHPPEPVLLLDPYAHLLPLTAACIKGAGMGAVWVGWSKAKNLGMAVMGVHARPR